LSATSRNVLLEAFFLLEGANRLHRAFTTGGKLGEVSDQSGSMVGNQAEASDKTENDMADAASRGEASMPLMERGTASRTMKHVILPGRSLALEICPNLAPNVNWVKLRTRWSQASICVRSFTQLTTRNHSRISAPSGSTS
jgi:hypothetical protein